MSVTKWFRSLWRLDSLYATLDGSKRSNPSERRDGGTDKLVDVRAGCCEYLHRLFTHAKIAVDSHPWRYRLKVRTEPSQGSNPGSSPGIATNPAKCQKWRLRQKARGELREGSRCIQGTANRVYWHWATAFSHDSESHIGNGRVSECLTIHNPSLFVK